MRCSIKSKLFSLVGVLLAPIFLFSNPYSPYVEKSISLQLSQSKEWKNLLHFESEESQIDDKRFFLSSFGKTNPQAELKATIEAFFAPILSSLEDLDFKLRSLLEEFNASQNELLMKPQDMHAICRFPARFAYLNSKLNFQNLPTPKCQIYNELYSKISPKSITLVFASGHINSPASMFGHNFLLFNSKYNSRLLSYALNYSAQVDETNTNGFIFALKGLSGGYNGRYSILPYYDKIKEYAYSENRDMWEFELNLNAQETLMAYKHVWELNNINSDYFFLDENCASNLLWILEIARPSVGLRKYFPSYVNPPQTLHIINDSGLISKTIYRPSKQSKLRTFEKKLSFSDLKLAQKIANGKISPQEISSHPRFILILECSAELTEFYYMKQKLSVEKYQEIAHSIASARSKLGKSQEIEVLIPSSPLMSHREFLIAPTYFSNLKSHFLGFETRFTYHGLEDSSIGIQRGMGIEFLKFLFGVSMQKNPKLYLQEFTLLSLQSLPAISTLIQSVSYRFQIGASRDFLNDRLNFYVNGGVGGSVAFGEYVYAYYLFEPMIYVPKIPQLAIANTLGGVFEIRSFKFLLSYSNVLYPQNFTADQFIVSNVFEASINFLVNTHFAFNFSSQISHFHKTYPLKTLYKAQIRIFL